MSHAQYDVMELENGEVFMYISNRYYCLSSTRPTNARSRLPSKIKMKIGNLSGQGHNLIEFFSILDETATEVVTELKEAGSKSNVTAKDVDEFLKILKAYGTLGSGAA